MEALLGTILGGAFRMMPELLKWLDRKDERKHELSMMDKQIEADKLRGQQEADIARINAETSLGLGDIQALVAATQAQAQRTGIKLIDGINSLMRPLITFWWVIVLYTASLVAQYCFLLDQGATGVGAMLTLWGPDEKAVASSIISFWFVDRSLRVGK